MLSRRAASEKEQEDWEQELAFWGINDEQEQQSDIELWEENLNAWQWFLSVPSFLKWNNNVCLGMDILAVQADAQLAGLDTNPSDYQKLKVIARTLTEELNSREQQRP